MIIPKERNIKTKVGKLVAIVSAPVIVELTPAATAAIRALHRNPVVTITVDCCLM